MFAKHTNPGLAASEVAEKLRQRNLVPRVQRDFKLDGMMG